MGKWPFLPALSALSPEGIAVVSACTFNNSCFAGCSLVGFMRANLVGWLSELGILGTCPLGERLSIWVPNSSLLREKLGVRGSLQLYGTAEAT